MGVVTEYKPFVKAIDAYFRSKPDVDQMYLISKLLDVSEGATEKIKEQLLFYSSFESKIEQILNLLEFLTIFTPEKISQIINNEKFMETYLGLLMESTNQGLMLQILRLWSDKFAKSKHEVAMVYEFIENLQFIGLEIPTTYQSKYENLDPSSFKDVNIENLESTNKSKLMDLKNLKGNVPPTEYLNQTLARAESVLGEGNVFLANFHVTHPRIIKQRADNTLEEISDNLIGLNSQLTFPYSEQQLKSIEELIAKLNKLQGELQKRIIEFSDFSHVSDGFAGPVMHDQEGRRHEDSKDQEERSGISMMKGREFEVYKTQKCPNSQCPFAPNEKRQDSSSQSNELLCIYYHGPQDLRRPILQEDKPALAYSFSMCPKKDKCKDTEKCEKAHNFVESFFHPLNYKKKRCASAGPCKNGKYCPYHHSKEEKEAWRKYLKSWINMDNEESPGMDDFEWLEELREPHMAEIYRHLPTFMVPNQVIPLPPSDPTINAHNSSPKKDHSDENAQVANKIPWDQNLKGKLVVRKKFVQPHKLTSVLNNHNSFYGVPYVFAILRNQDNENQNGEHDQPVERVETDIL